MPNPKNRQTTSTIHLNSIMEAAFDLVSKCVILHCPVFDFSLTLHPIDYLPLLKLSSYLRPLMRHNKRIQWCLLNGERVQYQL